MSKKVSYVRLQTPAHIPSVGDLGVVLPPAGKTLEHLSMLDDGETLQVSFVFKGQEKSIGIPKANISLLEYIVEAPKASLKAVK